MVEIARSRFAPVGGPPRRVLSRHRFALRPWALFLCVLTFACGGGPSNGDGPTQRQAGSLSASGDAGVADSRVAEPARESAGSARSAGREPPPATVRSPRPTRAETTPDRRRTERDAVSPLGPDLGPEELAALETAILDGMAELREFVDSEGTMRWNGRLSRGDLIVIEDGRSGEGRVRGDVLPGLPVELRVDGELAEIAETPDLNTLWTRVVLRVLVDRPERTTIEIHWKLKE